MSDFFEKLYLLITALIDRIEYCADLFDSGIEFIGTSWDYLTGMIINLPAAVQGIFILALSLGVLCLIFHR